MNGKVWDIEDNNFSEKLLHFDLEYLIIITLEAGMQVDDDVKVWQLFKLLASLDVSFVFKLLFTFSSSLTI